MRRASRWQVAGLIALAVTMIVSPRIAVADPGSPSGSTGPARSVFDPEQAYDPSARTDLHPMTATDSPVSPAPAADANGGSLALTATSTVEGAQGPAIAAVLPGQHGDSAQLHNLGQVARTASDGTVVWQRSTESLYADWRVTFQDQTGFVPTPQVASSSDVVDPFYLANSTQYGLANTHPIAAGDLAGDHSPDVAIAETVGLNLGGMFCLACDWPFDVPGSDLHVGSFVTVLDGATGKTLYSELDPGVVTQLAITDGSLIVGDETGDPTRTDPDGAWGSSTSVHALTFSHTGSPRDHSRHHHGNGELAGHTAWIWSTQAPWARLLDLVPAADSVALSWSDTPLGLGTPRPPDGHVVTLDARTGRLRWDVRTKGYPVLLGYDARRSLVAVADETDATETIGYAMLGLRLRDGQDRIQVTISGSEPTSLAVGRSWLLGGAVTSTDLVSPPNWDFTAGIVSAIDPDRQKVDWSTSVGTTGHPTLPGSILAEDSKGARGTVIVAGYPLWYGPMGATPSDPLERENELTAVDESTGAIRWDDTGDLPDPASVLLSGHQVLGVTEDDAAVGYDLATGHQQQRSAQFADALTALHHDVNGDGTPDLIVGTQSGGVFAFDGRDPSRQLWQSTLAGPVHQLALVQSSPTAEPLIAAAATSEVDVLDLRTGSVTLRRPYPGQYVWSLAVGTLGHHQAGVVVATDRLDAFDAATGQDLWTYRPKTGSYFSDPALIGGTVVAEYQSAVTFPDPPTTMAAVGIDAATGRVNWSATQDTTKTSQALLWDGVYASPDIAGAGADPVAMAWRDADGSGRVEVRDARTGAIAYTDTDDAIAGHQSWAVDPKYGLVSIAPEAVVAVRPTGAVEVDGMDGGTSAAFVQSGGASVLLTAESSIGAYPGSVVRRGSAGAPLAGYSGLLSGQITAVDGSYAIATESDQRAFDIVGYDESTGRPPIPLQRPIAYERGVALLDVTGTPASGTAARPKTLAPNKQRPDVLSVGAGTPSIGTAVPQVELKVHGYSASGTPQLTTTAPPPYDPALLHRYLGLTGDGSGQTVAVVDAYADPKVTADLNAFSSQFGLPQTCGSAGAGQDCFAFSVSTPKGTTSDGNWGLETSLDVEWIHALAPRATIRLVDAADASAASLYAAVDRAAALHPDVTSLSWGYPTEFSDEGFYDAHCGQDKPLCVASTGDTGHPGGYPSYDSSTIAVGGTTLELGNDGTVSAETAWSGSGGGQSYFEPKSAAQSRVVSGTKRGIPDVSFDADPATGVAVYDSLPYEGQSGWYQVGGTSLGAPAWSAILADTDQLRTAAGKAPLSAADDGAARVIYQSQAIADITSGGSNGICPGQCSATSGYDFVTGMGSPRAGIDKDLAGTP